MTARTEDEALRVELGDRNLRKANQAAVSSFVARLGNAKSTATRAGQKPRFVLMNQTDVAQMGLAGVRIHGMQIVVDERLAMGSFALMDQAPNAETVLR